MPEADPRARPDPAPGAGSLPMPAQAPKPQRFRPSCTHVTMDRFYGGTCYMCGRKSPLGWVYVCSQDDGSAADPWEALAKQESDYAVTADAPFDKTSQLKRLGFSRSIIEQADRGLYTQAQLERLVWQKQNVITVIKDQSPDKPVPDTGCDSPAPNAPSFARERARRLRAIRPRCRWKCCHTCRADFRGRAFHSFEAVLEDKFKPLRLSDVGDLPVHDAQTVRTIGLKTPPLVAMSSFSTDSTAGPGDSTYTWETTESDVVFQEQENDNARSFYKVQSMTPMDYMYPGYDHMPSLTKGIRTGLINPIKNIFRNRRDSSSEGSTVTLPLAPFSKKPAGDSDPSLPESFFRPESRGSSTLGIAPSTCDGEDSTVLQMDTPTDCPPELIKDDNESFADDELEGGVLLTEESVELHKPDLIVQDVIAQA